MKLNLTSKQQEILRWLVDLINQGQIGETFYYDEGYEEGPMIDYDTKAIQGDKAGTRSMLALFEREGLLKTVSIGRDSDSFQCTATGRLLEAVRSNFAETESQTPVSTLAQPHPPEIAMSLDRLRTKYPDPKRLGFLVMRFAASKPYERIVETIKATAAKHGIMVVRADEHEFHADLWGNVRTFLHGCGFGIAIYERIETNEPNANVGLEVGYLMAMNKPVLLLKDKTVETLQADLAGKLYKQFDPHDPEGSIPEQLEKWLKDYGIVVPG